MSKPKFDWKLFQSRHEQGQSLTEVAISLSVLLLIVAGILDLGRLYFVLVAMEDGAGEAALYLSINPYCIHASDVPPIPPYPAGSSCADPNNAEYRATHAGGELIDWTGATMDFWRPAPAVGNPVKVTIQYDFPFITPIIPQATGVNPIKLSVSATQIILVER